MNINKDVQCSVIYNIPNDKYPNELSSWNTTLAFLNVSDPETLIQRY